MLLAIACFGQYGANYPQASTNSANTFSAAQTFSAQIISSLATGTAPLSIASTTQVSNLNVASCNPSCNLNGTVTSGVQGTGAVVLANTPTLTTPAIGAATGTSLALTGKVGTYNNVATAGIGSVPVYGVIALTAKNTDQAGQNVITSAAAGDYRVCAGARTTTSGSGTTSTLNIIWTDEGGAKTDTVGTFALNSVTVTGQINKCEFIHATAASAIQCSTSGGTYGTSVYALSCTAEQLQ